MKSFATWKSAALLLTCVGFGSAALATTPPFPKYDAYDNAQSHAQAKEHPPDPEIMKLVAELDNSDTSVVENAASKLADFGESALAALYDAWEKGPGAVTAKAEALIQSIRKTHGLPTWVNGMEFKLIADKEWAVPTAQSPNGNTSINISLQFTNTNHKPIRVAVSHKTKLILKDAIGREVLLLHGSSTKKPPVSSPVLKRGDSYTLRYLATLIGLRDKAPSLNINEPFVEGRWRSFNGLSNGKYELAISYKNDEKVSPKGDPYWTGEAETLSQPFVVK